MPHNLTQTVISEHLADGSMTVGDEIALRIDLPPLQDVLYADFDTSVNRIVAQPFLLNAEVDRCHRFTVPITRNSEQHQVALCTRLPDPPIAGQSSPGVELCTTVRFSDPPRR
jgi:hypothetical protein